MSSFPAIRPLILASSSPRRQELLREAGYCFEVIPPREHVESSPQPDEPVELAVQRLACEKAADVAAGRTSGLVLAADTLVECDRELIGKPTSREDARRILQRLAGRSHRVLTGICLWDVARGWQRQAFDETWLEMCELTPQALEDYLDSERWRGKAGAFGYQDANDWVRIVRGSESNVVGLPLELFAALLASCPADGASPIQ